MSETTSQYTWNNAQIDGVRINDEIIDFRKHIISEEDKDILKALLCLRILVSECVSKLPTTKKERKEENMNRTINHRLVKDVKVLIRSFQEMEERDAIIERSMKILTECLWIKQHVLNLGLPYFDEEDLQDIGTKARMT